MEQNVIMKALVLVKRIGSLLDDVMDISRQIAEALKRNDQVSVNILIAMRGEPINNLMVADNALRKYLSEMVSEADRERLTGLLNGKVFPKADEEPLVKQAASNSRQMEKLVAIDEILNKKVARENSIYNK